MEDVRKSKDEIKIASCELKRIKENPNGLAEKAIQKLLNESTNNEIFHSTIRRLKTLNSTYGDILLANRETYDFVMDESLYQCDEQKETYCDTNSNYSMTSYMVCILCLILFISVIVMVCQKQK